MMRIGVENLLCFSSRKELQYLHLASFYFEKVKRVAISNFHFENIFYGVCQRFPGCTVSALLHLNQFVENSIEHLLFILPTNKYNAIVL